MLAYLVQFGGQSAHPGSTNLLDPLLLIVGGAVAGGIIFVLLRFAAGRSRAIAAHWRGRRRRVRVAATAERRARAMMGELCPHGWRAQLTLFQGTDTQDNGEPARGAVALDWFELTPGDQQPAIRRRVWAETIADALEAMVCDRRTDETLEQIELQASADGVMWPDLSDPA